MLGQVYRLSWVVYQFNYQLIKSSSEIPSSYRTPNCRSCTMAFYSHTRATFAWHGVKCDVLRSWWIIDWTWLTACPRIWGEEHVPLSVPNEAHGIDSAKRLFTEELSSGLLRHGWFDSLASGPFCRGEEGWNVYHKGEGTLTWAIRIFFPFQSP